MAKPIAGMAYDWRPEIHGLKMPGDQNGTTNGLWAALMKPPQDRYLLTLRAAPFVLCYISDNRRESTWCGSGSVIGEPTRTD